MGQNLTRKNFAELQQKVHKFVEEGGELFYELQLAQRTSSSAITVPERS